MSGRPSLKAALWGIVALVGACKGDTGPSDPETVKVQLLNATNYSYELRASGQVAPGTVPVAYGGSTGCTTVDFKSPNLTINPTGSTTPMGAVNDFPQSASSFVILAFPTGGGMGLTSEADPVSVTNQSDVQVFNATDRSVDAYVTAPGAALGTATRPFIAVGAAAQKPVVVPPGAYQVRFTTAGSQTVIADAGTLTLASGQRISVVATMPAMGQTTFRTFIAAPCE